jgi:1-acyl-sn-glycerol-3-phosphate acyltransferase
MGTRSLSSVTGPIKDFSITIILWAYNVLGYFFILSPFYLYAWFFSPEREAAFQKLNHLHYRRLFTLIRILIPRVKWRIAGNVSALRSSIIVANHLSFFDPILLTSLFEKQKTIVRSDFFSVPVFGWILKTSGYMPSSAESLFAEDTMDRIRGIPDFLSEGGNFFVFPEGTRSRTGSIGSFNKGAFRIARRCRAPIQVIVIRNTGKLFPPDRFLLNTREDFCIEVLLAGTINPDYDSEGFTLSSVMVEAQAMMEDKVNS